MKVEKVLQSWTDKHQLLRDRRQWIVKHPAKCANARRGNLVQDYAKATYLTQEANMRRELKACGVSLPQEIDREPKVQVVVFSPVRKSGRVGSKNEAIAEQESVRCLTEKLASGA